MSLSSGQKTTNQISISSGINWRTVEAHLLFLVESGDVMEVVRSEYVRIFRLTGQGEQKLRMARKNARELNPKLEVVINGQSVEIR